MRLLSLALCLFVFASCKKQVDQEQVAAREKLSYIIGVHDEIMPQQMKVSAKIKALEAHVDSTEQGRAYAETIKQLDSAYHGMNDWMRDFGVVYKGVINNKEPLSEEQLTGLQSQLESVEGLKALYEESFSRADSLLAK